MNTNVGNVSRVQTTSTGMESHTVVTASADKQAKKISKVANETFREYEVFQMKDEPITFIVKKGADITDPKIKGMKEKATKVEVEVLGKTAMESTAQKDIFEAVGGGMEMPSGTLELVKAFEQATEGMRINDEGNLEKPYVEAGKTKYYDTGMTPGGFKAMLATSLNVRNHSQQIFTVIGGDGKKQEVYSKIAEENKIAEGKVNLVHKGSFLAKGGVGTVYKALEVMRKEVVILKETTDIKEEEFWHQKTPTDNEAAILKDINPDGKHMGVQKAPHHVIRIAGKSTRVSGFVIYRYDGDLSGAISPESEKHVTFTTDQILNGFEQLCSGATHLDAINVKNLDVKSANVFIKKVGDSYEFDISDFDAANKMTDEYFKSDEFREHPAGGSSSDSISYAELKWLKKVGTEIAKRHLELDGGVKTDDSGQKQKIKGLRQKLEGATVWKAKKLKKEIADKEKEVKALQEKYKGIVKGVQSYALAVIGFQLLKGDVVKWESDLSSDEIQKLSKKIVDNDAELPPEEVLARLNLLNNIEMNLKELPKPKDKLQITKDTIIPSRKDVNKLWINVHEVHLSYLKFLKAVGG